MTLTANLQAFAEAVGGDIGVILKTRGSLTALTTTEKTTLVGAINELVAKVNDTSGMVDALIDDTAASASKTYSSDKIVTLLSQLKSEILGGVSEAYDTLKEIANYLSANDGALAALLTSINQKVSFAEAQTLTSAQQLQACTNIGVGDPTSNLVSFYTTARTTAAT